MARVALRDIEKRFGSTHALRGASLEVESGSIHALLGENGAGKSALVRVLYGALTPDAGEIRIDDVPVRFASPRDALARGIGLVHQHFMLVPALSVAENLVLGEPGGAWLGPAALRRRASEIAERWALDLDPAARVETLAVGQMQRVEIVRALARGARTLVLDEPTAVLAPPEVDALLALLVRLREAGHGIVLISHKLAEITAVCDQVTVLRAGRSVATRPVAGVTAEELGRRMVGDALPVPRGPIAAEPGPVALRLRAVRTEGLGPLDLEVRAGEVVVLAGIDGNGQGPLEELLAGVRGLESGALELAAPPLAVVSGDRQRTGLALELSVAENLVLEDAGRGGGEVFRRGVLDRDALARAAAAAIERYGVRAAPQDPARALSGGNQQKLCVARALRRAPGVLVAVNPTRGLDVAATAAVRDEIRAQARSGTAVLVISTELDEVLELGNRIGVLFRGELAVLAPAEALGREHIGRLMLGEPA